ncbi:MAG: deacylase, partial [Cyclobacteriaceae bacterium]|nr:deacylase [Cyclobacteriaceae bacterium]
MESYNSISLKYGWQNPGYTDWQKIYKASYYGIGFYVANFNNAIEIGNPLALYGFFGIPIVRLKKLEFYTDLQLGVAS